MSVEERRSTEKVDDANDNIVEYKWDIYGNRTELKYKDNTINYTYNQFNKIDKVIRNGEDYATYTYDVRGNTSSLVRQGIQTEYSYDELNRRVSYTNSKADKVLSTYNYTYDGENNILTETINGVKNTYTYNESDELKTSSKTIDGKVVNTEYQYDLFGNKVESSDNGYSKVYRYNKDNQLTSINEQGVGITDIYYDDNGNMIDILYAGGYREHYEYDEFDQVIKLQTNRERTWTYEYDADGDRIQEDKKVKDKSLEGNGKPDQDLWYDYLQSLKFTEVKELLEEKNANDTFDSIRSQIIFRNEHEGICASGAGRPVDPHEKDSSTSYVLDKSVENALILSSNEDFNIYGEERISTESDEERLTYISGLNESVFATVTQDTSTAELQDIMETVSYDDAGNTVDMLGGFGYNGEKADESGNIYLRARYYNPRIGQFVQIDSYRGTQDSISSQQRYTYCANNQYKYVDPNGHFVFTTMGIIGAAWIGLGFGTAIGIGYAGYKKVEKINKERESNTLSKGAGTVAGVAEEAISKTTPKDKPKKTTTGKEKATKTDKNKASNTVTKEVEPEPCVTDKLKDTNGALDAIQTLISIIGFIPVLGDIMDALNGLVSYLRGMYLDAIIDIGSAVLSSVGDTLLKPLRYAKGKVIDLLAGVLKKHPKLPSLFSNGINYFANKINNCKIIPSKIRKWVTDVADNFNKYIDNLFESAEIVVKKEKVASDIAKYGKRYAYMGSTPGKNSRAGREVIERMRKKGKIKTMNEVEMFYDRVEKKWFPLSEADMGHYPKDAVTWWNEEGRFLGAKSKEVRTWMLSSENYELQYYKRNRSAGGKSKERYLEPAIW